DCSGKPAWNVRGADFLVGGVTSANVTVVDAGVSEAGPTCTVQPLKSGGAPTLVVDFGRLVNGQLRVGLDAPAGVRIEIGYGESLNVTYVDTFTTRAGSNHIRPFMRRHGRYIFLTFHELRKPVTVRGVWFDHTTYPVKRAGQFESSDPVLDTIYETSARTLQTCMHDHFEDCAWREQTLYCGDLHVSSAVASTMFGDYALARKCLRNLAWIQRDDGALPMNGPRGALGKVIVEFVAHWVMALRNYVLASGDTSLA
ncbi:unnamed protein product, partial [marine sediment metagenome]